MGVNAVAWVRNGLDLATISALKGRLDHFCPAEVVWHWDRTGARDAHWAWDVAPSAESIAAGFCAIYGPGMGIHVRAQVMIIWSLARWRGFIQNPDLRTRVRGATAHVARVLSAMELIWLPEGITENIVPEGESSSFDELRGRLLAHLGPPQPSLDRISASVLAAAESEPPAVWFEDRVR